MKRVALGFLTIAVIVAVVTFAARGSGDVREGSSSEITEAKADSVWYHASDVALLATTGRPQLLEFFHPD